MSSLSNADAGRRQRNRSTKAAMSGPNYRRVAGSPSAVTVAVLSGGPRHAFGKTDE